MLDNVFDTSSLLADERTRIATAAAGLPKGSGTVYLAAEGGERMAQGVRSMFGIEEPAVTKVNDLKSILQKYESGINTAEQALSAASELRMGGYLDYAKQMQEFAVSLANAETNRINAEKETSTTTKPDYNQQARAYVSTIVSSSNWVDSLENWQELLANMEKIGYTGTDPHDTIQKKITAEIKSRDDRNKLVHGDIKLLGEKWSSSGMGDLQGRLESLEDLVELHTKPLIINGEQAYDKTGFALRTGDLPGVSFKNRAIKYAPNEAGDQARDFLGKLSGVVNSRLKTLSGSQVTQQEWERLQNEYQTGIATSEQLIKWIYNVRKNLEQSKRDMYATYDQEASIIYQLRQGYIPRLTDPSHIKYIPIGRYYYDINGNLRKREK